VPDPGKKEVVGRAIEQPNCPLVTLRMAIGESILDSLPTTTLREVGPSIEC